jgi:hypothetical protein
LNKVVLNIGFFRIFTHNKNYKETYQVPNKMKTTLDLFGIRAYDQLIEIQDWVQFKHFNKEATGQLNHSLAALENTVNNLRKNFGL